MVPTVAIITTMADGMTTLGTIDTGLVVGIISMGAHGFRSPLAIDMVLVVVISMTMDLGCLIRASIITEWDVAITFGEVSGETILGSMFISMVAGTTDRVASGSIFHSLIGIPQLAVICTMA